MELGNFLYLLSIIIFGGGYIVAKWQKRKKALIQNKTVIIVILLLSLIYALFEYFALQWGAWNYSADRVLGPIFVTYIETYLFALVIAFIVSTSTLNSMKKIDAQKKRTKYRKT